MPTEMIDYNHTHGNTSGATDISGGMPGANNVTGDPRFVAAATADFRIYSDSPLKGAGLNNTNIGGVEYVPTMPTEAQVESGVDFGVNDEFTGTLVAGGGVASWRRGPRYAL